MIRVYDTKNKSWLQDDFCLMSNGDLAEIKRKPFGLEKINLLSDTRYIYHNDIGAYDSNGNLIFEGDICELNLDKETIYCVVAYIGERAAYLLFDEKNFAYYSFNNYSIERMSVVGNVLDNQDFLDSYVGSIEEGE